MDKSIMFKGPMVRALLDGRKTQTRRVLKPQPIGRPELHEPMSDEEPYWAIFDADEIATKVRVPYAVGDRLYVREAHAFDGPVCWYYATDNVHELRRKRPSIHMPRWASRLTLTVTDVRVQRLNDISDADAIAEGVPLIHEGNTGDEPFCPLCEGNGVHGAFGAGYGVTEVDCADCVTARQKFQNLWNSIHGPDAWDTNPWVVAVSFDVRKGNIDG